LALDEDENEGSFKAPQIPPGNWLKVSSWPVAASS
jgi:hypothetical protein